MIKDLEVGDIVMDITTKRKFIITKKYYDLNNEVKYEIKDHPVYQGCFMYLHSFPDGYIKLDKFGQILYE